MNQKVFASVLKSKGEKLKPQVSDIPPPWSLLANTFTEKGTFLPFFHGYQFGPGPDPKLLYLTSSNMDQITIKINNTIVTLGYNN